MTRTIYSGPASEQVWAGLRRAGCSSAFALPASAPVEVRVHVSQSNQAEQWLADHGFRQRKHVAVGEQVLMFR